MSERTRPWSGSASGLHGRDDELRQLHRLLSADQRCAVVLGLPGAGKTAVLAAATDSARSDAWTVLTAAGRIADRSLPFAALGELLADARPSQWTRDRHERLLRQIRGEDAGAPSAVGLRLDVQAWLEDVAGKDPLLLVVDDAQWVDPTTRQILAFLGHRLAGTSLALLFATRSDQPPEDLADLPRVALRPLDAADSVRVLRAAGLDPGPVHLPAVVERAAGNPLALLEFARATPDGDGLLAELDVPTRVEQAFTADLPGLPEETRRALLLAAAGAEDLGVLSRAAGGEEVLAALAPAELAALIRVHGRHVRFRHPLARQAVYAAATAAERVRAHRALADAYEDDPDRQAWHRAEATLVPDEAVADGLAAAARRAIDRVAYPEAARAMRRAVELTPDRRVRERRLLALLEVGLPTGQAGALLDLARRLRDGTEDLAVQAHAQQLIAFALIRQMDQEAARLALEDAIARLAEVDLAGVWASLTSLAVLVYDTAGDPGVLIRWVERLEREGDLDPMAAACRLWVRIAARPTERPPDLIAAVQGAVPLPAVVPPLVVGLRAMLLGGAAWLLDLPELALVHLREARSVLEGANSQEIVPALTALAQVLLEGRALDEAEETARILHEIADAQGLEYQRAVAQYMAAAVTALRGERLEARRIAEDVLAKIDLTACVALEVGLRVAIADSWFHEDDLARWEQLRSVFEVNGRPRHGRLSVRALAAAVSAGVRCGRAEEARVLLDGVTRALPDPPSAHQMMGLTLARALLAPDADAEALFRQVVDDAEHARWAFDLAEARLEYGRWLRVRRRHPEARTHLLAALRTFERLGTVPWSGAARDELRHAGGATLSPDRSLWSSLTAQERQVVRLAAAGRTNREIGAALFLSPRTVGVHLYNAFPKLGVTARRQLRDLVERFDR